MRLVSRNLARRGWVLRSGGAEGADSAFYEAIGYDADLPASQIEIYFPWKNFSKGVQSAHIKLDSPTDEAYGIASLYHPAWYALKQGAKKLIARNTHQVLGADVKTPCDVVLCWTKGGKEVGGTAQAIRIAKANDIPVYNFGDPLTNNLLSDILYPYD